MLARLDLGATSAERATIIPTLTRHRLSANGRTRVRGPDLSVCGRSTAVRDVPGSAGHRRRLRHLDGHKDSAPRERDRCHWKLFYDAKSRAERETPAERARLSIIR